jgi:hypothetical protein
VATVSEIQQLVGAGSVRLLVEINYLHVAIHKRDFGEVEFRFAVDV